ncbi:MAG: amidase family protein, partial [Patescibacteria group bacterium]
RTNMDEFAMGASTENSAFGSTKNPFDLTRVSGGSSGGSASAVAMDGCLGALGSDTGGSIRQPASFCGVVGLNPTYGAVSRFGLIAMASSFDQIGPMTKTVEDAEIIFNAIKGKDAMDSSSKDSPWMIEKKLKEKLKVGVIKYDKSGVDKEINESLEKSIKIFKDMGYEVSEIDLPNIKYSVPCYYILVPAEVSSNLARFDGVKYGLFKEGKSLTEDYMKTREVGFGLEVRRRIILGTYVLSAGYYDDYYIKAQKVRELIRMDFDKAFDLASGGVDVIISPVSPSTAFKIGEKTNDPLKMYLEDIFTAPAKMAGLPAISIPNGFDLIGLPIGLQITAPRFGEKLLFEIGKKYESNL